MNIFDKQRFKELYGKFEAGDRTEALQELRDFARKIDDPWDRTEMLYHETLWLLELDKIQDARLRLEDLKRALAALTEDPPDGLEIVLPISLTVMARYAEIRVLFFENKDSEALEALEGLMSRYVKQLSTPDFRTIFDEIQTLHGLLLVNCDRWAEARPFLESASAPEAWKSMVAFYLGQCYYALRDYQAAKQKLVEALSQGLKGVWEARAHYVLGIVQYHLSNMKSAKHEFELCVKTGNPEYLRATRIWEWLDASARAVDLQSGADGLDSDPPPKSKLN